LKASIDRANDLAWLQVLGGKASLQKLSRGGDDFVAVEAPKLNRDQTNYRAAAATPSTAITCGLQNSIEFNKRWNLVWDQGSEVQILSPRPISSATCCRHSVSAASFPTLAKSARMGHPLRERCKQQIKGGPPSITLSALSRDT
jgi:hypothetical protein